MDKIVKLAILAVIVYLGVTEVLPRISNIGNSRSRGSAESMGGEGGHCVMEAERAANDFGDGIRQFSRPPLDVEAWGSVEMQLSSTLYEADSACGCPEESCEMAREAISEMQSIVDEFTAAFSGSERVPVNAARQMNRVYDLLDDAKRLAR